jgi:hypothetical protein
VKYLIDKVVDDVNKLHVIIFFTLETWKGWLDEKKNQYPDKNEINQNFLLHNNNEKRY